MSTPTSSASGPATASRKTPIIVVACLVAIGASWWWMWRANFAGPKRNQELHRTIGRVMAEETIRVLGGRGKILLISIDPKAVPELVWQLDGFNNALDASGGIVIAKTYELESEGKAK